jgi:hypothetical protein
MIAVERRDDQPRITVVTRGGAKIGENAMKTSPHHCRNLVPAAPLDALGEISLTCR